MPSLLEDHRTKFECDRLGEAARYFLAESAFRFGEDDGNGFGIPHDHDGLRCLKEMPDSLSELTDADNVHQARVYTIVCTTALRSSTGTTTISMNASFPLLEAQRVG